MKHCKYCNIDVDTSNDFCPLCFNHLEEVNSSYEQFYTPRLKNETADRKKHFTALIAAVSMRASVIIPAISAVMAATKPMANEAPSFIFT